MEFHLPVVHSEKALTKPKNPFEKPRGKLVDLSMHKLPERKPGHKTKLAPFNFNRKKKSQDQPSQHIETFSNPTAIDRIEFGKRYIFYFSCKIKHTTAGEDVALLCGLLREPSRFKVKLQDTHSLLIR